MDDLGNIWNQLNNLIFHINFKTSYNVETYFNGFKDVYKITIKDNNNNIIHHFEIEAIEKKSVSIIKHEFQIIIDSLISIKKFKENEILI